MIANAAEIEQTTVIDWERDHDGIVTLTLDDPNQSTNTMNYEFTRQFEARVDRLAAERDEVRGVIITSAKKTFLAGGDLSFLVKAGRDDVDLVNALQSGMRAALRKLETLGFPVVAAINGAALGGGYELAAACHYRIALNAPSTVVGLPEVTLGLLPGLGGTVRTVRRLGLLPALEKVLLTGDRFRPAEALELGLIDEVVETEAELLEAAKLWIIRNPLAIQPWDQPDFEIPGGSLAARDIKTILPLLPAILRTQTQGSPVPARRDILAATVEGLQVDFDNALLIESRYSTNLICGQVSTNLIQAMFFDLQSINRGDSRPEAPAPFRATRVLVLGGGMMGAGIAYSCAKSGLHVTIKDVSAEAAAKGKAYSERIVTRHVASDRMSQDSADELLSRIATTDSIADGAGSDLVIEAVFEDVTLKQSVMSEAIGIVSPVALLATNTSTLPITDLSDGIERSADYIGLHFFSPVDKMQLVEIVVGERTSSEALAKGIDVVRQIGKVPIVVSDSRGFFTSRVVTQFTEEGLILLAEGVPAASIEQAAKQSGYPVGPLALIDEIGMTLIREIRERTINSPEYLPLDSSKSKAGKVMKNMVDDHGRSGRASGAGFYSYEEGRRRGLWPELGANFGGCNLDISFRDMQERMLFAESLDAVRCFEAGVLSSVAGANVGSILGIGFPAWTGGVIQYIEQYDGGIAGFVDRSKQLAERYGDRFKPPVSLVEKAASGKGFR